MAKTPKGWHKQFLCIAPIIFIFLAQGLFFSSCIKDVPGCTDPSSPDYDPDATVDDGTCGFATPESYIFIRQERATVDISIPVVHQLLIESLEQKLLKLGETGAAPVTADELLAYLDHPDFPNLVIDIDLGQSLTGSDSVFSALSSSVALSERLVDIPPLSLTVKDLNRWLNEIADNSNNAKLGTPEVYTSADGLDLAQMVSLTLMGSALYGYAADSIIPYLDTLDNITVGNSTKYTPSENGWDQVYGCFGAARYYREFADVDLTTVPDIEGRFSYFRDRNMDDEINWKSEYNYGFARLAGLRDAGSGGTTDFTEEVFAAFLEGRAAITVGPGNEAIALANREIILSTWEKIIAATFVHHLNGVIAEMTKGGTADYDLYLHNRHWAGMYGHLRMLGFHSMGLLGSAASIQSQYVDRIGEAPNYALPGSQEYGDYVSELESVRADIGGVYGFSAGQLEGW